MPPLRGFRNRGYDPMGSVSTIDSIVSDSGSTAALRPSSYYNSEAIARQRVRDRENNYRKLEEVSAKLDKISSSSRSSASGTSKGLFSNYNVDKFRQSFRGSNKSEAIRNWEARQANKKNEKGLFATMDERGYHNKPSNFEGWGKEKPKEIIRTIYLPARSEQKQDMAQASRAMITLPPNTEGKDSIAEVEKISRKGSKRSYKRTYPRCPSPESDEDIQKLNYWVEYNDDGPEYSVDRPKYLQQIRGCPSIGSSAAMGTIFEGLNDDSFAESDEINLPLSCTEYDGDWDSSDVEDERDSEMGEVEMAMHLTRPFNLGAPTGRRCPKIKDLTVKETSTTEGQYGVQESENVLRLRGGNKSSTGDSDIMDTDVSPSKSARGSKKRSTDMKEYRW